MNIIVLLLVIIQGLALGFGYLELYQFLAIFIATLALWMSMSSLKETVNARRDGYLPILRIYQDVFHYINNDSGCDAIIVNLGNGRAFNLVAHLPYVRAESYKRKVVEIMKDYRQNEGTYKYTFGISDSDIGQKKLSNVEFVMTYEDIFGRRITSKYDIIQEKVRENCFKPKIKEGSFRVIKKETWR